MAFVFNFDTNVSKDDIKEIFKRFDKDSSKSLEDGEKGGLDSGEFEEMILSFASEKAKE
jgi:hypothetical protein